MISMWKHNSKRLKQVCNVVSCYKLVDWLFLDLKKILYWWSYGVWKSPRNDFPFMLITKNTACNMISMWKHNSKKLKQVWNVVSCYKLVDWLFLDLKKILYWWSYGVWKSPCNDFPFILITKNRGCDMISMWKHNSKKLKQVGNVVSCYKLVDWLFSDLKKILYWWSYGVWKSPRNDFPFMLITKNRGCDMISMWKHKSKKLKQDWNVVSCYKIVDWLFSDLKKILYWWSYGVWKSPGNDFQFILITKNRGCDMRSMWRHVSKIQKQVVNVISCYKLVNRLF